MDDIFHDAFSRLLSGECEPRTVRLIEGQTPEGQAAASALWQSLEDAGFANLLVPESADGAGLNLGEAAPLVALCGRHALPLPLALTMLVRAWLARCETPVPEGPVTVAQRPLTMQDGTYRTSQVPFGRTSAWVLVQHGSGCELWPTQGAQMEADGIHGSLECTWAWQGVPHGTIAVPAVDPQMVRAAGAAVTAMMMTGALERVLEMTIQYANERSQFGRPIGKFQSIQQQISVLAEHTFSARMAARLACPGKGVEPTMMGAAIAKSYVSEIAAGSANVAHAVHGAIGITQEHDLQLYTRRLHAWRLSFGSESVWQEALGQAWFDSGQSALDFMRAPYDPKAVAA